MYHMKTWRDERAKGAQMATNGEQDNECWCLMRGELNVRRMHDEVVLIAGIGRGSGHGHAVRLEAEKTRWRAVVAGVDVPAAVALAELEATAVGHFDDALDVVVANAGVFPLRASKSSEAFADAFGAGSVERKPLR